MTRDPKSPAQFQISSNTCSVVTGVDGADLFERVDVRRIVRIARELVHQFYRCVWTGRVPSTPGSQKIDDAAADQTADRLETHPVEDRQLFLAGDHLPTAFLKTVLSRGRIRRSGCLIKARRCGQRGVLRTWLPQRRRIRVATERAGSPLVTPSRSSCADRGATWSRCGG